LAYSHGLVEWPCSVASVTIRPDGLRI
jgi:hypothetical protein